ncbi:DUF2892 domain-containing protein [Haloarculaceae archaeon H-GB11]|nr:DUF2892 domain-containing protein [Haloarculaceae archaeon H-GB11]
MQQNVGNIDRLVRLVIGAPLLAVALGALADFLSPPVERPPRRWACSWARFS